MNAYRSALAGLLLLAGCVRESGDGEVRLRNFRVTIADGVNIGSPDARLPFATQPVNFPIQITAIGTNGQPFPFNGKVLVTAEPGQVVGGADLIDVVNGEASVNVPVRLTFGDAAIWVQHVDPVVSEGGVFNCNAGCPSGTSCFKGRVCAGPDASMATGIAGPIFFDDPRISDLQTTTDAGTSALVNESLTISGGDMVVTGVIGNGFYVTDIEDADHRFDSLFVFTFNQPEEVGLGFRLAKISGIAAEFVGTTQLTQPGFDVIEEDRVDLIPLPKIIEPAEVTDISGLALEPFESGLVEVRGATLATRLVHCDSQAEGGDGSTDLNTPAERACADACFAEPGCSELTNFFRFGQFQLTMADGQTKIQVVSRDTIREFDPTAPENAGRRVSSVIGILKDIEFADPRWVVQPRFPSDLALEPKN